MRSCARPSTSRFGAPSLLVPKKQYEGITAKDMLRACVNYKKLNDITVKSKYPMPYIEDLLDRVKGQIFSVIDSEDFYHQTRIHNTHSQKIMLK
jgi:hypothetical protein